jgi:uncharacterized Zn finger protein
MLLITCPVTRTDELVAHRRIRSVVNHPTHVAIAVECPGCGAVHVLRTGRRWEAARARVAARSASTATARAAAQTEAADATRAARVGAPA